jgi:hypothetical protein
MLTLISRNTGPKSLEPIGKKYLFNKAAEFVPDRTKKLPHLFTPFNVRNTIAVQTWPFFTSLLFLTFFLTILFFTTTVIVSPTLAPTLDDELSRRIQLTKTAPELSATFNIVCTLIIFFYNSCKHGETKRRRVKSPNYWTLWNTFYLKNNLPGPQRIYL